MKTESLANIQAACITQVIRAKVADVLLGELSSSQYTEEMHTSKTQTHNAGATMAATSHLKYDGLTGICLNM